MCFFAVILTGEVSLVCKQPVPVQPARQIWGTQQPIIPNTQESKGKYFFFPHREAARTIFSFCFFLVLRHSLSVCERDVAKRLPSCNGYFAIRQLAELQLHVFVYFFSPQPCFSDQKTSNLEAYVKWFNRLCYLVATEICMVSGKHAARFTYTCSTSLRWYTNKQTWGFISYDLADSKF